MEKRRMRFLSRFAAGLTLLSLAGGWATNAQAAIAYAFAEQTISGLTINPAVTPTSAVVFRTQDSASVNGTGTSRADGLDVLQTYIGGTPPAPENTFTRYAPGNPPVSPTTPPNFTRGDAAIPVPSGVGNTSSVVSESYLNTAALGVSSEDASSGLTASFSFTVATTGTLAISYTYANRAFVYTDSGPPANASADFHFNITIKDAAGNIVFSSSTANTNLSLVAPPPGNEIIRGPTTETVNTGTLTTGIGYTLIFSSTSQTSVTAAVPEPSMMAMLGVAGVFGLGYYRKVRRVRVAA